MDNRVNKKRSKQMHGSIKGRWIKHIFIVTLGVLLALLCVLIYSATMRYDNAAEMTLRARVSGSVNTFFDYYNDGSDDTFSKGASEFIESFQYKDVMEVWVLDEKGDFLISSSGFSVTEKGEYTDYTNALSSPDNTAVERIRTASGEPVTAMTYILRDKHGEQYGAVRYLISMEEMYNQLTVLCIIIILAFILIAVMISMSGLYFVSSIVNPVEKICRTTGEIAKGNFNVRIKNDYYDDEIGELCDSINNMAKQLSEIDKMKNEFISTVSHEIRTPLTAIKGWGETLKNTEGNSEITRRGIDIILEETTRLSSMVEELLDFSRIQNDSMKLVFDEVDVAAVLMQVYLIYKQKAESENKHLEMPEIKDEILIIGDSDRIRQVFINILDNAIKYTPTGGEIKITVERIKKCAKIVFSDTGCGISTEDIKHIKEKFYKANNTVRGTGIGLAVADEIIKMHNGEINITSELTKGTQVEVILPVCEKGDLNEQRKNSK